MRSYTHYTRGQVRPSATKPRGRRMRAADFKPTDLTLREMVEKYLNGFHAEFQTPEQQELASKIRARFAESK